jgi:hypothetical protein
MKIQKRHWFVIFSFFLLILGLEIYQYTKTIKEEFVSAVTVGTPNPGHSLAQLECSASSLCVDTVNNRVGVGTANPSYKLQIEGGNEYVLGGIGSSSVSPYTSANKLIFSNEYNDTSRGPNKIVLYDNGFLAGLGVHASTVAYYSGAEHVFYQATTAANAVEKMRITSGGNVGIGTAAPSQKLEVNGNIKATDVCAGSKCLSAAADAMTCRTVSFNIPRGQSTVNCNSNEYVMGCNFQIGGNLGDTNDWVWYASTQGCTYNHACGNSMTAYLMCCTH